MAYLQASDFNKQIQSDNLSQVTGGDAAVLAAVQAVAVEEAKSYLIQKYDLSQELADFVVWSNLATYKAGARLLDGTGVMYYAKDPAPRFEYDTVYLKGDQVFWKDKVYTALVNTNVPSAGDALQFARYENVPPYPAPDDVNLGPTYWGTGTAYSVPAGTPLSNTTYYVQGDPRSQMLVMYMVDIALYHLHTRIAPRNIPDLRVKRYDDAIHQLKAYARGEITAAFPVLQPRQGGRIRYGGNVKNQNTY